MIEDNIIATAHDVANRFEEEFNRFLPSRRTTTTTGDQQ